MRRRLTVADLSASFTLYACCHESNQAVIDLLTH
jgi:hypothetical protein